MKTLTKASLVLLGLNVICIGALVIYLHQKPEEPVRAGEKPTMMAKYLLREYIRHDLGADPNAFKIYGWAERNGPRRWLASGSYKTPLGPSLKWEMVVFGPYDGDMWRNCGLKIDGEVATRVGSSVPCS